MLLTRAAVSVRRRAVKRLVWAVVITASITAIISSSTVFASGGPPVAFSFASKALEIKRPIVAKLCGVDAAGGSQTYLQEQQGTLRIWKSVGPPVALSGDQCSSIRLATPNMGRFLFRLRYWVNGRLIYISPMQGVTVYGPVGLAAFCTAEGACNLASGTVEIGGRLVSYIGEAGAGVVINGADYNLPATYSFGSANTCRSLTLKTIMADQTGTETAGDAVTVAVVQRRLNEQSASVLYDQVTTENFQLDGGPFQVQITGSTEREIFYVLAGTLDCHTPTGQ